MNLETCTSCKTQMMPMANGNCPSCGKKWDMLVAAEAIEVGVEPAVKKEPFIDVCARFMKAKSQLIFGLGIIIIIAGFFGFEFTRHGKSVSSGETLPVGIMLLIIGALLFVLSWMYLKSKGK